MRIWCAAVVYGPNSGGGNESDVAACNGKRFISSFTVTIVKKCVLHLDLFPLCCFDISQLTSPLVSCLINVSVHTDFVNLVSRKIGNSKGHEFGVVSSWH